MEPQLRVRVLVLETPSGASISDTDPHVKRWPCAHGGRLTSGLTSPGHCPILLGCLKG